MKLIKQAEVDVIAAAYCDPHNVVGALYRSKAKIQSPLRSPPPLSMQSSLLQFVENAQRQVGPSASVSIPFHSIAAGVRLVPLFRSLLYSPCRSRKVSIPVPVLAAAADTHGFQFSSSIRTFLSVAICASVNLRAALAFSRSFRSFSSISIRALCFSDRLLLLMMLPAPPLLLLLPSSPIRTFLSAAICASVTLRAALACSLSSRSFSSSSIRALCFSDILLTEDEEASRLPELPLLPPNLAFLLDAAVVSERRTTTVSALAMAGSSCWVTRSTVDGEGGSSIVSVLPTTSNPTSGETSSSWMYGTQNNRVCNLALSNLRVRYLDESSPDDEPPFVGSIKFFKTTPNVLSFAEQSKCDNDDEEEGTRGGA